MLVRWLFLVRLNAETLNHPSIGASRIPATEPAKTISKQSSNYVKVVAKIYFRSLIRFINVSPNLTPSLFDFGDTLCQFTSAIYPTTSRRMI